MIKKLIGLMISVLLPFSLVACNPLEEGEMKFDLKQGIYTTDDGIATITLYGDNLFTFEIIYMSHLPTGNYSIKNNKLILNYSDNYELIFEIGDDQIIFEGANDDGEFLEEGPVKVQTIFKKTILEIETDNMVNCIDFYYHPAMSWIGNLIELN